MHSVCRDKETPPEEEETDPCFSPEMPLHAGVGIGCSFFEIDFTSFRLELCRD
jgi:hypothetical protein